MFITGAPRCGSSWVGIVLGNCPATRYVYEPFNHRWSPALRQALQHFQYLSAGSDILPAVQKHADKAFRGTQGWKQLQRAAFRGYLPAAIRPANRVIVKDPTAALMTDWIADQFNAQVLFIMRHPCGFASSLEKLGWKLDTGNLLRQPQLVHEHLEAFVKILQDTRNDKWLNRGAFWAAIHTVIKTQMEQHQDWLVFRYEDICDDPLSQFTEMTQKLNLELNDGARKKIQALSGSVRTGSGSTSRISTNMPGIWKQRMSPGEIDAVMGVVREFGLNYY